MERLHAIQDEPLAIGDLVVFSLLGLGVVLRAEFDGESRSPSVGPFGATRATLLNLVSPS